MDREEEKEEEVHRGRGSFTTTRTHSRVMLSRRKEGRKEGRKTTFDWGNFHAGIMHACMHAKGPFDWEKHKRRENNVDVGDGFPKVQCRKSKKPKWILLQFVPEDNEFICKPTKLFS